jgi:hypothetical protein
MCYAGAVEAGERAVAPFRALARPIADMIRPRRYPEIYPLEIVFAGAPDFYIFLRHDSLLLWHSRSQTPVWERECHNGRLASQPSLAIMEFRTLSSVLYRRVRSSISGVWLVSHQ